MINPWNVVPGRRRFWASLLAPYVLCLGTTFELRASRPNIVVILVDDLRHDTFGWKGHPFVETPHVDSLAKEGMRFTNAFVTTSLCSPSRASFLTGQYMHHHGVVGNADSRTDQLVTFPRLLQRSGYRTAFIGKWHMGNSTSSPQPGFNHWVSFRGQGTYAAAGQKLNVDGNEIPRRGYMTDELTRYATRWIENQDGDHPFLLYLSHKGVHGLYDPAPRHRDRYQGQTIRLPASLANTPRNVAGKPMWVQDQRNSWHGVEFPYHGRSGQSVSTMYQHYCEMILSIDDSVGRVMQSLRNQGLARNTLVLFTSDGGHLWGEHGLIDKRCAYEESIRIPMLAHFPAKIAPGTKCEAIVANIDVAPTLLQLAGVALPEGLDGRSFGRLLQDPSAVAAWRKELLYEYYWDPRFPQTPTMFALRSERYKLIQYHGIWDTDELYDIVNDPQEMHNLIRDPEHFELVMDMRQRIRQHLEASDGLAMRIQLKRDAGANLRKLGGSQRARFPSHLLRKEPQAE